MVDGNDATVEQVEKQLNKLIDVIKLRRLSDGGTIRRELMLLKVQCTEKTRGDIMDVVRVMDAKVSDISKTTLTVEISDTTERLEIIGELLKPFGILEVVRTGTIALEKGAGVIRA